MHYTRWRNHGTLANPARGDVWAKIDKNGPGGCWLWLASRKTGGYGQYVRDGHSMAHRYVYELAVGPIPEGMELDHLCRVRHCVNPDHLEPVTRQENIARSGHPAATAMRFNTCHKGHPLSGDNLYIRPSEPNHRVCRTCERDRRRRRKAA